MFLFIRHNMLARPTEYSQKDIFLICDVPIKVEIENGEPYSAQSNFTLLHGLRTGRINPHNDRQIPGFKSIISRDIWKTYLDYDYYGDSEVQKNFDFNKEILKNSPKKKVIFKEDERYFNEEGQEFFSLEHHKDVFVSERLLNQFNCLLEEIRQVKPKLIIVTGKWSLFFLTNNTSLAKTMGTTKDKKPFGELMKYRSSILSVCPDLGTFEHDPILVPIFHPVNAINMPDKVPIMEIDLQKLSYRYYKIKEVGTSYFKAPKRTAIICNTVEKALQQIRALRKILDRKPTLVSVDIETVFKSTIDCIGFACRKDYGFCIPFAHKGKANFWSLEDEITIMVALNRLFAHPNMQAFGQNFNYDCQYFYKLWKIKVVSHHDTMHLQHILYSYLPKNLAFIASVYCEFYSNWKDEITALEANPEIRWNYNIKDCMFTYEVLIQQIAIMKNEVQSLQDLYDFTQKRLVPVIIYMMNKGVGINKPEKERFYYIFKQLMDDITVKINDVLGMEFNQNSTPQKQGLFRDFFGMTLKKSRKSGNDTCDASAMLDYIQEYPRYRPFLTLLLEYASLKVFVNNFLGMQLDEDDRARTQYNVAKTPTGRLASSKNVWGRGANFQNVPEKGKINLKVALGILEENEEVDIDIYKDLLYEGTLKLPNVKKIFIPKPGYEMADFDLSGADIQVVAYDSECKFLIDYFDAPKGDGKVYRWISQNYLQREIPDDEYKKHKMIYLGLGYGMGLLKLAHSARLPYELAKGLMEYYFHICPELPRWQERIRKEIQQRGYITNIFGRRAWFLNNLDKTLYNKAYAFIGQSTIADTINKATANVYEKFVKPELESIIFDRFGNPIRKLETTLYCDIDLQVHDSLVFEYPVAIATTMREALRKEMVIDIPYQKVLRIPSDYKVSEVSYGDCKKVKV